MTTGFGQGTVVAGRRSCRRVFTLVELVLSMAIMAILMGGMASAVLVASHALPDEQNPSVAVVAGSDVLDAIAGELLCATSITERADRSVVLTVADRDNDTVEEVIRYAWSGTPGDPLKRQYNGGAVVSVCEGVQEFVLSYFVEAAQLPESVTVLLVVDDAGSPNDDDRGRKATVESWGHTVALISAGASQASFDSAVASSDVVYVSETTLSFDLGTKLRDAAIGVVNEEGQLYDEFGISSDVYGVYYHSIDITDNTHEITSVFPTGILTICSSAEGLLVTSGTLAGGARTLAEVPLSSSRFLVVIEPGGALYDGGTAAGRRVKLPWGNTGEFDFDELNSDGRKLMQRTIEWAAAPHVCTAVRITLQPGDDSGSRVETQVQVLNAPEVRGS